MSVRRQNENDFAYRRPTISTSKKVNINTDQNAKALPGKTASAAKPSNASSKPEALTNKDVSKLGATKRTALSSLTNGTPQLSRQPLASKPRAQTARPALAHTARSSNKAGGSKTPAKTKSVKKTLTVYTPAATKNEPEINEVDEVEYMAPTAVDMPYDLPTAFRMSTENDRDLFAPAPPPRVKDIKFSLEFTPEPEHCFEPRGLEAESELNLDDLVFDP